MTDAANRESGPTMSSKRATTNALTVAERERQHLRVLSEATGMPLYEFKCVKCGREKEMLFKSFDAMQQTTDWECGALLDEQPVPTRCTGFMERQASAPGVIDMRGFSHINGYSSPRTISQRHGSVKTTVSGNFEAFSDGLVNR